MNFVCLVFELGDKTLTLSPMENLMVKCNHMEHPLEGGKKVYINGQGHMTKMAAMAINRKNL